MESACANSPHAIQPTSRSLPRFTYYINSLINNAQRIDCQPLSRNDLTTTCYTFLHELRVLHYQYRGGMTPRISASPRLLSILQVLFSLQLNYKQGLRYSKHRQLDQRTDFRHGHITNESLALTLPACVGDSRCSQLLLDELGGVFTSISPMATDRTNQRI